MQRLLQKSALVPATKTYLLADSDELGEVLQNSATVFVTCVPITK